MKKRKDFRLALVFATIAGMTFLGYLIDNGRTSKPDAQRAAMDTGQRTSRLVHQSFQQAVAMLHAERYEYAVQSLHEVLALRPALPEAHVNMGFALLGMDNHAAARDFFDSATALRPSQYNAYWGLAVSSEELGDLAAAVAAMKTFVHLAPADDPYRRKAAAAIWEWQAELARQGL